MGHYMLLVKLLKKESEPSEVLSTYKWHRKLSLPLMKLIWPSNWQRQKKKMQRYRVMMMKMRNKLVWAAKPVLMVKAMMKTIRVPIVNEKRQFARKDSFLYYNLRINIHQNM